MCGASSQQTQLGDAQTAFYNQMVQENSQVFGQNQAILSSLNKSFEPILAAGINQEGFSAGEKANLDAQAVEGTGANYSKAANALAVQQGAEGGGNTYIPTGAKQQQQAQLATSAAQSESGIESDITAQDYATGRQNYEQAAQVLGGVAGQYDPTGYSNAATGAGSAASTTENEISQANSSWMGLVSGALGAAGTAAGGYFAGH